MKIIFDKPITLEDDVILCATKHDIEINAPIKSLNGSVKILGKRVILTATISAKLETHLCGLDFTHTTKESRIFSEKNIIIGSGDYPCVNGFFISKKMIHFLKIIK
jgi:hypothetical protein